MRMDCLLTGVGGQGIVLASKIIAQSGMEQQVFARTSETIGMAQRGGCVVSHVRLGDSAVSPVIPTGRADLLIGFEPAEALRHLSFLKPQGKLLVNCQPVIPITASLGKGSYQADDMLSHLKQSEHELLVVDGEKLCRAAGTAKVLNVLLLGVALRERLLPFTLNEVLTTIRKKLPSKFLELNQKALTIGYDYKDIHAKHEIL